MRKRPLAYIACVFLTGLVYQRYHVKLLLMLIPLVILWEIWSGRKSKKILKIAGRSVLLLSAFLLGIYHMQSEESFRQAYMSKVEDGSRVTVWGELIKTETTDYGVRGVLSNCYLGLGEKKIPCNDVMVYFSSENFQTGQIYKIIGKLNAFSEARNQGNFNQRCYYQSLKIDFAVQEEQCFILSENKSTLRKRLFSLRDKVGVIYSSSLSEKSAGFYQAMVLGDKTNLDDMLQDLFVLGGISHILAISGLHVSILGRGLYRLLRGCGVGFWLAGVLGSVVLLSYGVMVGNSTSTIRAVGMLLLFFFSQGLGRSYDMLNALGAMVLYLLWENPFLVENNGFWFSVTALLGVGIVGKELSYTENYSVQRNRSKLKQKNERVNLSGLWMSLGITVTTLPVTACSYYEIPMYAPLVNFIALPILTPIFCIAIVGGVIGLWFPGLAAIVLQPCEWLLFFYEWLCNTVAKLPGASVICGMPSSWQVVLYYGILFGGTCLLKAERNHVSIHRSVERDSEKLRKNSSLQRKIVVTGIITLCLACILFPKDKSFEITFLDVGQGDGIYISAGDGTTYFIDGGSTNVTSVGEYRILPFLKAKGVKSIDYWFVSHADTDHISGLLEIMESGYVIKHLVVAENAPKDENYEMLQVIAKKAEVKVLHMEVGHRICTEGMEITCLAPSDNWKLSEDRNESSLVLLVEWNDNMSSQGFKALFAGDISMETEELLCEKGLFEDVDLFKAIHHGSNYSNGLQILDRIQPEYIVVSCSENNLYGHPGVQAIKRMEDAGATIFYTMKSGEIRIEIDKKGLVKLSSSLIQ